MTRIIGASGVKGGKVQLTFSQLKKNPASRVNILALANADDDRFSASNKERQAWLTCSPGIAAQITRDSKVGSLKEGEEMELNVENPSLGGHSLCLQVVESTTAKDEYQLKNIITTAKQYTDKDGVIHYVVTAEGAPIFSNTTIVAEKDMKDSYYENTKSISEDEFLAIAESADVKLAAKAGE